MIPEVTHNSKMNESVIIKQGSCVRYVMYSDYSGHRIIFNSPEYKKIIKKGHYEEV